MSNLYLVYPQRTSSTVISRKPFSVTRRLFEWLTHQRKARRDMRVLLSFDDRMLADIGLSRGEINYAVMNGRIPVTRIEPSSR